MKTVTATELKANVSAILGDVERGETVAVTRHGKVVARIAPETTGRSEDWTGPTRDLRSLRDALPKAGITIDDILQWRDGGRRF